MALNNFFVQTNWILVVKTVLASKGTAKKVPNKKKTCQIPKKTGDVLQQKM